MAAAIPDRAVLYRADGRLAMETEAHGNRRDKSLGTKVRRQKPDPAARPPLASGVPPRTLVYQSATGTRAATKFPVQTTEPTHRGGAGRNPTSEIRHPSMQHPAPRPPGLNLHCESGLATLHASELGATSDASIYNRFIVRLLLLLPVCL